MNCVINSKTTVRILDLNRELISDKDKALDLTALDVTLTITLES